MATDEEAERKPAEWECVDDTAAMELADHPRLRCRTCKSDRVQWQCWVEVNTHRLIEPVAEFESREHSWCAHCQAHTELEVIPTVYEVRALPEGRRVTVVELQDDADVEEMVADYLARRRSLEGGAQ